MTTLTASLLDQYQADGYLLLRDVLPRSVFDGMIARVDEVVDRRAKELKEQGLISNLYEDEPFPTRWQKIVAEAGGKQTRRSWDDEIICESLFDLMRHPELLDALETIFGPEVFATGIIAVRPKIPSDKRTTVLWHQDSHYYGKDTTPLSIITVWIPLVPATTENGCMQVIPGSHRWGYQEAEMDPEHNAYRPIENPEKRGTPRACEMNVGDVLMFNNLTFHRSTENYSESTRWSVDLRYCTPDAKFERFDSFMPGFVARSSTRPVGDWETWKKRTDAWRQQNTK